MGTNLSELLEGTCDNYVFPFFWLHGESEETLRHYMDVIEKANCRAVCVESRPHPDFCGPGWWRDMDIILDEARGRNMKVWILDDSHFPTGFANGAALSAPNDLRRQSVYTKTFPLKGGETEFRCDLEKTMSSVPTTFMGNLMNLLLKNGRFRFSDNCLLAVNVGTKGGNRPIPLAYQIRGKTLTAALPPNSKWVYITFLTRNAGIHRSYINMLEPESCALQLRAVYEPHWEHYRADFGKTIAGFFSDEPEIGNGAYFNNNITVGTDFDLPWSRSLQNTLETRWGADWKQMLPLLWTDEFSCELTPKIRTEYMDAVTTLVETSFSRQIGDWCRAHGVEYIGHMIEDGNQHARLGASLGHYYRGLAGQHMAGIDDIGGQVFPQGEDAPAEGIYKLTGGRDGEFYHYLLGKLGVSAAAIDPQKHGRCMCEIFGNYGWSEGTRLEKYLADHFLSQGVNRFVPHAFSPKKYPDRDCPPHFYAGGHNPQYRAFGQLMAYVNRVCALLDGGKSVTETAVLYHAEGEWAGDAMLSQKPARVLMEHQIDFHVIPADVFSRPEAFRSSFANGFSVNGYRYSSLIVPAMRLIPRALSDALPELLRSGCRVLFVDRLPEGIAEGGQLPQLSLKTASLSELPSLVEREMILTPPRPRIRYFHYRGEEEIYFFVNEDDRDYEGFASLSKMAGCCRYDPWSNRLYTQSVVQDAERSILPLFLHPGESALFLSGDHAAREAFPDSRTMEELELPLTWHRSVCRAVDYPRFRDRTPIDSFEDYGKHDPHFSGFIAYSAALPEMKGDKRLFLQITDAGETAEVFLNGKSLGIQAVPPFLYELDGALQEGPAELRIEIATTLERERRTNRKKWKPTGITGSVRFLTEKRR